MRYSVPEVSCYTEENGDAAAGRARWSRRTAFPLQSEPFDGEQSTGAAGGSSGQRRSGKVWRGSCSRRGTAGGGARPPPLLEAPALCYWSGRGRPAGAQDQPAGGASPGPAGGGREPRSGRRGREPSCDGGCRRSFHPTKEHGEDSMCATLGLTEKQWKMHEALGGGRLYICKNCEYKQHQCFACGFLGSSDLKSGPEVFQCKHERCGHFYHPNCVAKLIHPDSENRAKLEEHIAGGLEFHCPMHQCKLCKETENKDDKEMRFAVCRRCPTAYHSKCLPSDISFEEFEDTGNPRRAWEKVLPKQILIYCMKHEIQLELGTPMRDHIVFPEGRKEFAAKRAGCTAQKHDILEKDELVDGPSSSKPSQSPRPPPRPPQSQPAETGPDRVKPIDSFAPKHLFPHPQPGSCGWLDE